MSIIRQTGGYRDPLKALSVKALEARQKAAAEAAAQATQLQEPISNPWQGASHIAGVLAGGLKEARADSAAADARDRLAQIKAGIDWTKGPTSQQIAEMSSLDPELSNQLGMKAYEEAIANRRQEDQQAFTAGESEKTRTHEDVTREDTQAAAAEQNELNRQADVARQKMSDAAAAGRQDDQQAAAQELARIEAQLAATEQQRKEAAASKEAQRVEGATAEDPIAKAVQDYNEGHFGEVGSDEAKSRLDIAIAAHGPKKGTGMAIDFNEDGSIAGIRQGEGVGQEAIGGNQGQKNIANAIEDYRAESKTATNTLASIGNMEKAMEDVGYSGPGGQTYGAIDDFLEGTIGQLGVPTLPGSSGARAVMETGQLQFLQDAISKTKGAITERENELFLRSAPGLSKTPEGNRMLLRIARKTSERAQERAQAAEDWIRDPAHQGSLNGFEAEWNEYITAEPLLTLDENGNLVVNEGTP